MLWYIVTLIRPCDKFAIWKVFQLSIRLLGDLKPTLCLLGDSLLVYGRSLLIPVLSIINCHVRDQTERLATTVPLGYNLRKRRSLLVRANLFQAFADYRFVYATEVERPIDSWYILGLLHATRRTTRWTIYRVSIG